MLRQLACALAITLTGLVADVSVARAQATINVEVPPGGWRAIRVRNLPKDAALSVAVKLAGTILVLVVEEDDSRRPKVGPKPLFRGVAQRRLSFSLAMPAAGSYFVVLDNRAGREPQAVEVTVNARRQRAPAPPRLELPPSGNDT